MIAACVSTALSRWKLPPPNLESTRTRDARETASFTRNSPFHPVVIGTPFRLLRRRASSLTRQRPTLLELHLRDHSPPDPGWCPLCANSPRSPTRNSSWRETGLARWNPRSSAVRAMGRHEHRKPGLVRRSDCHSGPMKSKLPSRLLRHRFPAIWPRRARVRPSREPFGHRLHGIAWNHSC